MRCLSCRTRVSAFHLRTCQGCERGLCLACRNLLRNKILCGDCLTRWRAGDRPPSPTTCAWDTREWDRRRAAYERRWERGGVR